MINETKWSSESCITACAGFAHAGVEMYGDACWCGVDVESPDKYGVSSDCVNGLGGLWAIDVYTVPNGTLLMFLFYCKNILPPRTAIPTDQRFE